MCTARCRAPGAPGAPAGGPLPGADAAGHVLARAAGDAVDLPAARRAPSGPCRRPHRAGRADCPTGRGSQAEGWRFDQLPAGTRARCSPAFRRSTRPPSRRCRRGRRRRCAWAGTRRVARGLCGHPPRGAATRWYPTIGVSHGTVTGCVTEHGVPMAGFDHEFTTGSLFAAQAQAFMLGHIHRHQTGSRTAVWCLCRFDRALPPRRAGDKGFVLWEVGASVTRFELVPTPARRTVDLFFEGKPDLRGSRRRCRIRAWKVPCARALGGGRRGSA